MMLNTILSVILVAGLIFYLVLLWLKPFRASTRTNVIVIGFTSLAIILILVFTGFKKINADLSRLFRNSSPKSPEKVYSILFGKPIYGCVSVRRFKDQLIPKFDCCIWMEVNLCSTELRRIIKLKNYQTFICNQRDSLAFLQPFNDKPGWWAPQSVGDTVIKLNFQFNRNNQQTLFFGNDSSRVFICDQAL